MIHVDFARVSLDEKVEVTVPLELKGTPKGEADGGVLQQIISELEVECLVTDIPDVIRHNVVGHGAERRAAHQGPEAAAGRAGAAGRGPDRRDGEGNRRGEAAAAAEAAAAEPEVIGRKAEDEARRPRRRRSEEKLPVVSCQWQ